MSRRCDVCAGTGQLCYFKGRSRFVMSYQECPVCCGTGLVDAAESPESDASKMADDRPARDGPLPQSDRDGEASHSD